MMVKDRTKRNPHSMGDSGIVPVDGMKQDVRVEGNVGSVLVRKHIKNV